MLENLELERLANLLFECPSIKNEDNRSFLVEMLPSHIVGAIKTSRQPRVYVLSIVKTCANYDDGFKHLFERLRYFDGETRQFKATLKEFINIASEVARGLEDTQAYEAAIQQWRTIQALAPTTQVWQTIQRLEEKIVQTSRITDLQKQLFKRQSDIESIYLEVARYLGSVEKQEIGVDNDVEKILKKIAEFLNDNITAAKFIEFWAKHSENPHPTTNTPNYQLLADGLQSGDIAIFLGTD